MRLLKNFFLQEKKLPFSTRCNEWQVPYRNHLGNLPKQPLKRRNYTFDFSFKVISCVFLLLCKIHSYSEEKIIFVHIPKSGGVSISSLFMNEFDLCQINNNGSNTISLYAYGFHFSLYEIDQMLPLNDFKLITFLRNPIDRVISEHKYCMGKHGADPQILRAHRLPPTGDPLETASNEMCKILSGLNDQDERISISEHLESSKEALRNRFFFVGITEKMEESLHLLYSLLNWNTPQEVPHLNATETTEIFSQEILQAIAERNWADIELYEYALSLYEKRKENNLSILEKQEQEVATFTSQISYTFDKKLNGAGWGLREVTYPSGPIHRWVTEKDISTVNFYLKPENDYQLKTCIFIHPLLADQLEISINGTPLSLQKALSQKSEEESFAWMEYQALIPKELIQEKATLVTFKLIPPENAEIYQLYCQPNPYQVKDNNYRKGSFACKQIQITQAIDCSGLN